MRVLEVIGSNSAPRERPGYLRDREPDSQHQPRDGLPHPGSCWSKRAWWSD
ncbi:MAG: hypothetical protein MZV70_40785 [Desulfobacterales bacterium]|nr:hypothetical protein [Desulfobacterales bacterium]